jgi:ribulose 1,5-bisphosphate carboxylase large subunit-like protein
MENNKIFIKVDDEKIINMNCIRWVKKMDECLQICSKANGCTGNVDTHKVCKNTNADSYRILNRYFA